MVSVAMPFLALALPFLAMGAGLSAYAMRRGGVSIREPGPLHDRPLRVFTLAMLLMLIGMVALFVALIRVVDRIQ